MIKEGDFPVLNQIIKEIESSYEKMKKAYEEKDSKTFNIMKKKIIQGQRKISKVISGKNKKK